jgi:hypothetical protein
VCIEREERGERREKIGDRERGGGKSRGDVIGKAAAVWGECEALLSSLSESPLL